MRKILTFAVLCLMSLTGCSNMSVEEFANADTTLMLEEFFEGKTRAWGLFEDRFGNVRREFIVDIEGDWDGKILTLSEELLYNDGERESRVWELETLGDGSWSGTTDAVIGSATGATAGNAFHWEYNFNLPVGDGTWKVHFDDWMFLQDDQTLMNRATVSKFGLTLGEVNIFFRKV